MAKDGATEWSAVVEAERDDDDSLYIPVLVLIYSSEECENALRVKLDGVYKTAEEAIAAGREAVKAMAMGGKA